MKKYYNYIDLFYQDISNTTFKGINSRKILKLKFASKNFYNYFNNKNIDCEKYKRYKKIMGEIKISRRKFNINSEAEKFILFMFCVDPTFEAFKIYSECNKIEEIHNKMMNKFGIYDKYLISIEKYFIKHFLSEKKQKEINEEIEERSYK